MPRRKKSDSALTFREMALEEAQRSFNRRRERGSKYDEVIEAAEAADPSVSTDLILRAIYGTGARPATILAPEVARHGAVTPVTPGGRRRRAVGAQPGAEARPTPGRFRRQGPGRGRP